MERMLVHMSNREYGCYYWIVKKLIGSVLPVGSHDVDKERYENLREMCYLIEDLLSDVADAASNAKAVEYSVSLLGKRAIKELQNIKEYVDEVLEGLKEDEANDDQ